MSSHARLVGVVAIGVLALAGCTQKSTTGSDNPVVSASPTISSLPTQTSSSTPPPPTATSTPAPSTSASSSSTRPSTPAPTTSTPKPSPSPTIEAGGCPTSALTVRALRGSGAAGQQFAFLQFTNNSTSTCSLTGYPGVQLLLGGRPLGAPATRSGKPFTKVSLAPGTSGTAGIIVDSACNASISDSVQVIPPNRTDKLALKLALRGCAATVDPITAS